MNALRIEWDENKNSANRHKHGISFEEAETVFADDHALLIADPEHSDNEDRFILLGMSSSLRIMVVCHYYRVQDDVIRIITARKATREEQDGYIKRRRI
jgi:uncharacterized DUF497 family protein